MKRTLGALLETMLNDIAQNGGLLIAKGSIEVVAKARSSKPAAYHVLSYGQILHVSGSANSAGGRDA